MTVMTVEKLEVCTDCYMAAAGYTAEETGYTPECEPLSLVDYEVVVPTQEGDAHYGKFPCEGCGTRLEGNRLEVSAWDR